MCEKHTTHTLMYETTQREERGGGVIGLHQIIREVGLSARGE